jgi:hypothetical protein
LAKLGVTKSGRAALCRVAAYDDLRTADLTGLSYHDGALRSEVWHQSLAPGQWVNLDAFLGGVPLGPVEDLPVYSSDAFGRWSGKAHAPGWCAHHEDLRADDDLLLLVDWLERLREVDSSPRHWSFSSPLCSKCGGFAIRRLTDEQQRYWHRVHELFTAANIVDRHDRYPAGASWLVAKPGREDWQRAACELDQVESMLSSPGDDPCLATYVEKLRARHEPLSRRTRMRTVLHEVR